MLQPFSGLILKINSHWIPPSLKLALKMVSLNIFAGWVESSRLTEHLHCLKYVIWSSRAWLFCSPFTIAYNAVWLELLCWQHASSIINTLKTSLHFSLRERLAAFCVSHCVICSALRPNNILLSCQLPLITGVHPGTYVKDCLLQEWLKGLLRVWSS